MIEGVIIGKLNQTCDDRGRVMHIMKQSEGLIKEIGEVYCSTIYPGTVKGWHLHQKMTLNYIVIKGMVKFVLYDERKNSLTCGKIQEIYMGDHNYVRVTVPPGIWNGFMGLGMEEAMVINVTDIPHDPDEIKRCEPHNSHIPYTWKVQDR